jgi:hypothetical protein
MPLLQMKAPHLPNPKISGITFVEILVAAVVGVAVISAAVIGYGTITRLPGKLERIDVDLPGSTHDDLYGTEALYVSVGPAPNYWEGIKAREMKDLLDSDVSKASAVFCLGRNGQMSGVRPAIIEVPDFTDFRVVATPGEFLDFLDEAAPGVAEAFDEDQNGALQTTNVSLFVLRELDDASQVDNTLEIQATWEVDLIPTTSPAGTFASVRRFDDGSAVPTHFFHVFYPDDDNSANPFRPLAVFFGRADRPSPGDYDVAPNHPFTFLWWPDPLVSFLSGRDTGSGDQMPRQGYAGMAGRTSLFFVLPTFPSL